MILIIILDDTKNNGIICYFDSIFNKCKSKGNTVSLHVYMQSISSQILMNVGLCVISMHDLH